jgi:hypothetical protein
MTTTTSRRVTTATCDMSKLHELLLRAVASFSMHPSFVKIFLSNEGMEAVAKFYASRKKNDSPSHSVAKLIQFLVHNTIMVLGPNDLSYEKAFSIIEKTGLLGQFIRWVPVDPESSAPIMKCLQTCLQLVKKKLKSGTPTGDILDTVISGKDGPINEKAKADLVRLQSLARLSNDNDYVSVKKCHHCEMIETQMDDAKFMKCQRCKLAYYCSKECQVANWKRHKKMCNEIASGVVSRSTLKTAGSTTQAFFKSNCFDIAKEVYKKTKEYNVPKKELFVEIDFGGDAPALRNAFQVWLTSGFLEGSSVADAPHWFRTHVDEKEMARTLMENYERLTSNDLLAVCRAGDNTVTVKPLRFLLDSYHFLSDEAVESIGREDYVGMVACLGQRTTDAYFREKRSAVA